MHDAILTVNTTFQNNANYLICGVLGTNWIFVCFYASGFNGLQKFTHR